MHTVKISKSFKRLCLNEIVTLIVMYFFTISFLIFVVIISSISDAPNKVYWDNTRCEGPSGFLIEPSIDISSIGTNDCLTCNKKFYQLLSNTILYRGYKYTRVW